MSDRSRSLLTSPYLLLLIPPLLWAGNAVIGRYIVGSLPPVTFAFWRWLLALVLIAPFGLRGVVAQWALIRRHRWLLLGLSLPSVVGYNTMLYMGLRTSGAVSVTLVAAAMPATIMVLASFWLRERLVLRQWLGMLVSFAGVLLVLGRGNPAQLLALDLNAGDLWAVAANLSWAVYSVMLRRFPTGLDSLTLLTTQILIGVPCIAPLYALELLSGHTATFDLPALASIAYAALFSSLAAYFFWNRGVAAVGPSVAGQYTYLLPVFTALMAALALGEHVQWFHGLGFLLIVSGMTLGNLRGKGGGKT